MVIIAAMVHMSVVITAHAQMPTVTITIIMMEGLCTTVHTTLRLETMAVGGIRLVTMTAIIGVAITTIGERVCLTGRKRCIPLTELNEFPC